MPTEVFVDKKTIYYALSIFLKNGEVLHLNGLSREEKDRYFALARNPEMSMLHEEGNEIRNLLGSDISSITYKRYTESYEKTIFQAEKMLLSESTFGTGIYFTIIKLFVALTVLWAIKETATNALKGDLMAVIMDADTLTKIFTDGVASASSIFKYAYLIMITFSLIDIVLGLTARYYINQDGAAPIRTRRFMGLLITIIFIIVVSLLNSIVFKI